ncbi:MAG: tRNA lysidine(34) synthetase TilS [Bacteroidales bacterium]|nr:tRNA lysidine(34) synthetase TilS [Bacteroidales bacterium]
MGRRDLQYKFDSTLQSLLGGWRGELLVAASGGVDSMVMTALCNGCRVDGLSFTVVHVNFSLRPGDCDLDEELARSSADRYGMKFLSHKVDTLEYCRKKGISIEMGARELRYDWFNALLEERGAGFVLVAHNLRDSAETLLLNLVRGTGLEGIRGMRPASGKVLRPMLRFDRSEIEEYAALHDIPFRQDLSNNDVSFARNRIRHNILPQMEAINPTAVRTLAEDMERFNQAAEVLDRLWEEKKNIICSPLENGVFCIDIDLLKSLPQPAYWLFRALEPYGFTSSQIKNIEKALDAQGGKVFMAPGHKLLTTGSQLRLYPLETQRDGDCEVVVTVFENHAGFDPRHPAPGQLYIDADSVCGEIECRPWKAGDAFTPLGMKGSKKLSDFFVDLKFDNEQKRQAKVLYAVGPDGKEQIVGVAGIRIDNRFRVKPSTSRIAMIQVRGSQPET